MYYDLKETGKRILNLRKQKSITQEQLAEKLNISVSNLGKIETGYSGVSIDEVIKTKRGSAESLIALGTSFS